MLLLLLIRRRRVASALRDVQLSNRRDVNGASEARAKTTQKTDFTSLFSGAAALVREICIEKM
jgi:hypothetical protein